MVLLKANQKIVPFEQSHLKKDEILAYWDQSHTRGSDIPLSVMMTARASFSRHTTLTSLIQGIRRLRQLEFGQRVDMIVSEEDSTIIRAALKQWTGKDVQKLELKDLILYAQYHEAMEQGDRNYRALHHKWKGYLIKKVMEIAGDLSLSVEEHNSLIRLVQELWVTKTSLNPYEQYGEIARKMNGKKIVEEELKALINSPAMQRLCLTPCPKSSF